MTFQVDRIDRIELKRQLNRYSENLLLKKGYTSDLSSFDDDLKFNFKRDIQSELKEELNTLLRVFLLSLYYIYQINNQYLTVCFLSLNVTPFE